MRRNIIKGKEKIRKNEFEGENKYRDSGEGGDHCVQPPGCPRGKIAIYIQYILF